VERQSGSGGPPQEPANASPEPPAEPPSLELAQLQEAWQRTVLPAVQQRKIHAAPVIGEAHPVALEGGTLTLEFPPKAAFQRKLAEEKYGDLLRDALYEVTGRKLALAFVLGEEREPESREHEPPSEEQLIALLKDEFDAREVEERA